MGKTQHEKLLIKQQFFEYRSSSCGQLPSIKEKHSDGAQKFEGTMREVILGRSLEKLALPQA